MPTSLEPPATSLARSAGGARGCGVEFEVRDGFRLSASDVRSARVERERPAEARAREWIACVESGGTRAVCARGPTCRQRGASSQSMTTHDEAAEKIRGIESKVVRQASILVARPPPLHPYRMRLSENCARKDERCV